MRNFKLFLSSILMLAFVNVSIKAYGQRRPKDRILDRKKFTITMEIQSDKKRAPDPFEDEISFRSNKLMSRQMLSQQGFIRGDYIIYETEEVLGENRYKFQAINKNSKGMSLKWEGSVFGDQIEGTAIVSKKGKIKEEYKFSGKLKD